MCPHVHCGNVSELLCQVQPDHRFQATASRPERPRQASQSEGSGPWQLLLAEEACVHDMIWTKTVNLTQVLMSTSLADSAQHQLCTFSSVAVDDNLLRQVPDYWPAGDDGHTRHN